MNLKTNPELLPIIEWWEKDGKQLVIYVAVAAIAVGGWYGWKAHRAAVRTAASEALTSAYTAEEMEEVVTKFGNTKAGGALKIRLAKKYFDDGRYEEALATYDGLIGTVDAAFADIPVVGKAQCLEALGKYAEAQAAFDDFVAKNEKSYLKLTAELGAARCLCEQEKKAEALKRLAAMKAALKSDDEISKARIEAIEKLVKRWTKPVPAAPKVEAPKAPVAKPAAPAAKPAAKPAAPAKK